MKRIAILLSLGLLVGLGLVIALAPVPRAGAQTSVAAISEADARAIAVEAYVYFYPLVSMDVTRKQLINTEPEQRSRRAHEHVRQYPSLPDGGHEGRGAAQFRYSLFERLGGSDP